MSLNRECVWRSFAPLRCAHLADGHVQGRPVARRARRCNESGATRRDSCVAAGPAQPSRVCVAAATAGHAAVQARSAGRWRSRTSTTRARCGAGCWRGYGRAPAGGACCGWRASRCGGLCCAGRWRPGAPRLPLAARPWRARCARGGRGGCTGVRRGCASRGASVAWQRAARSCGCQACLTRCLLVSAAQGISGNGRLRAALGAEGLVRHGEEPAACGGHGGAPLRPAEAPDAPAPVLARGAVAVCPVAARRGARAPLGV